MESDEPIDQGLHAIWELIKIVFETLVEFAKMFIETIAKVIPDIINQIKKGF